MDKIFIVIPTYNEADNIEDTIDQIFKSTREVKTHEINIIVVDAASPDGTYDIVEKISKNNGKVFALKEKKKRGIGYAYNHAMDIAFNKYKAKAIMTFDADLSHDPAKIPQFVKAYDEDINIIVGTRYKKGGSIPTQWAWYRKLLSILGNKFISLIFLEFGLSDYTSGYKLIDKEVYEKIKNKIRRQNGYTFSISVSLEALKAGYQITEVPYNFKDRVSGKSKIGLEYIINGLYYVLSLRAKLLLKSRFGKVIIAGGFGGIAQLFTYAFLFRPIFEDGNAFLLPYTFDVGPVHIFPRLLVAQGFSIECGIFTSFYINNTWAFVEKKLTGYMFFRRYVKNHIVVTGAIIIQLFIVQTLSIAIGRGTFRDIMFQVIGILIGLVWNFYFYKRVIWKVHRKN